ncbi:MAG: HlyC/CorC family transporter [Verrucomicrobia bacterium]|nr:HlyC/CorC family transporter [Verrucomicrobiota bacterium]
MLTSTLFIALFFLLASSVLTALSAALHTQGRLYAEEELKQESSPFFFRYFLNFFFGKHKWEGLLFSLSFTKHLLRVGFVLSGYFALMEEWGKPDTLTIFFVSLILLFCSLICDFLCSLFGQTKPKAAFSSLSSVSSAILLLCIPLTAPFFRLMKCLLPKSSVPKKIAPSFRIRDKVHEILQETELGAYLDPNEQKLILSVVSFKERIVREVMVPRINLFSIDAETSIHEAATSFLKEQYSRIPVYKESVDNIIGVLFYKDVLKIYVEQGGSKEALNAPVEKILKPTLYTPETKKISLLLQEFRSKRIHLAIVVDEWGGTEGIVTIEDILEELVGEIADEYDTGGQNLYISLPGGGWIVDAKMAIIDILEELGVKIPHSSEYDTVGGYIFHKAGAIPSSGWRIHHDDFDIEILSSSERAIEKVKILPHH